MKNKTLAPDTNIYLWTSEPEDLAAMPANLAARIYFDLCLINYFEHAALRLKNAGAIWGPVHTSVGQEATAGAVIHALHTADKVTGTHRSHHHFLAKAMQYVLPSDWQPHTDTLPEEGFIALRRTLAEIMGLAPGFCGGRGGSMHLRWVEAGFLGSNAIVGGGIPLSTGAAFAEKQRKTGNIVVCYFGDGAVNQGAFHEACNFAGLWELPVLFFLENNFYAVGTHAEAACAANPIALRATAYNMDAHIVDGSDPVALYEVTKQAVGQIRSTNRPVFIEARCYRTYHHAGDQPGSAFKYRDKEEEAWWRERESVTQFPRQLKKTGLLDEKALKTIQNRAQEAVQAAVDFCVEDGPNPKVRSELWPKPQSVAVGLRSNGGEWDSIRFQEREDFHAWRELRYSDAIAAATGRWLERDPMVFTLGEEVANFGGGAYGATKNLPARFPERVLNTPISEAGFVGIALGAAMSEMRPVVEVMFPDFSLVAADQLFNQIGKARHMYGDTTQLPLVARIRIATGCGYGGQHSMDPVGLYALFPGWRMVAPSTAFDYIGLFNSAMQSLDPVVILEHHSLYGETFPVPEDNLDYMVRFGKARILAEGEDVTIATYGCMTGRCERLLSRWRDMGIYPDLIDLRTLDLPSIDYDTLGNSLRKTGQCVIVEQAASSQSIGKQIAATLQERFFDELDGPIACLASLDVPPSVSRVLEEAALLDDDAIVETAALVAHGKWR